MLPIYVMVLMFDIVMVIVKFSSTESDHEASLFKKVMIFEIGFDDVSDLFGMFWGCSEVILE